MTDAEGRFNAPFLTPGSYGVRAELQGFKATDIKSCFRSASDRPPTSRLKMEVGGLTETVEVTGIDRRRSTTRSTTTGAVLSSDLLAKVPVGRRFSDALYLAPGVSSSGSAGRANPSISGGTGLDNQYVVDGVNVTNQGYGALGSYSIIFGSLGNATPFDFIKEIQVKTGGYEAEFGQSTGGVVNVITKSGIERAPRLAVRLLAPERARGRLQAVPDAPTAPCRHSARTSRATSASKSAVRSSRTLFFFGAINPSWETRDVQAPAGFPLREPRRRRSRAADAARTRPRAPGSSAARTASTRRSSAIRRRARTGRSACRR